MARGKRRKQAGKRRKRRFDPTDGAVLAPGEAIARGHSSDAAPLRVASLLSTLSSGGEDERELAAGSLATLAGVLVDPEGASPGEVTEAGSLLDPKTLSSLRACLFDSSLRVRTGLGGVLRNIAVASLDGAEALAEGDGIAAVLGVLTSTLKAIQNGTSTGASGLGEGVEALLRWTLVDHLVTLVQAMGEASEEATMAFTGAGMGGILHDLLAKGAGESGEEDENDFSRVPGNVVASVAKAVMTLGDANPEFVAAFHAAAGGNENSIGVLIPLLQDDATLQAILAVGVYESLGGRAIRPDLFVPAVELLKHTLGEWDGPSSLGQVEDDGVGGSVNGDEVGSGPSPQEMWLNGASAARMAAELLANLLVGDDEEEEEERGGDDGLVAGGLDEEVVGVVDPAQVLRDIVLGCVGLLPEPVHAMAMAQASTSARMRAYYAVQSRAIALGTNAWLVLGTEDAVSLAAPVWSLVLGLLSEINPEGPTGDLIEPCLLFLLALLQRAGAEPKVGAAVFASVDSGTIWGLLTGLATESSDPHVRTRATDAACIFASAVDLTSQSDDARTSVVAFLLNQFQDAELPVVLEAADAAFTLFEPQAMDPQLSASSALSTFAALEASLQTVIESALESGSLPEDLLYRADEVSTNIPRFIEYKQQQ